MINFSNPTVIAAIVGALGALMAALIALLGREKAKTAGHRDGNQRSVRTSGDNSPAVTNVQTSGENSPVIVGNVTIYQHVAREYLETVGRKQWRPLGMAVWAVFAEFDREDFLNELTTDMVHAAFQVFSQSGYAEFTVLVDAPLQPDANNILNYVLLSPKVSFCTDAVRRHRESYKRALEARQQGQLDAELNRIEEEWKTNPLNDWSTIRRFSANSRYQALVVRFDPESHKIDIKPSTIDSTNLVDFDNHLGTTSELLQWLAIVLETRRTHIQDFGDADWINESPQLAKLLADLVDGGFAWGKVHMNLADSEDWDYANPRFDAELKGRF